MKKSILIVEDEFIVANDLSCFLKNQNYDVLGIAASVEEALQFMDKKEPDMVLLDIHLKGKLTGIDLAKKLQVDNIPFIYLSAYSNRSILEEAKATKPYGFLVKPFREKDLLIALEIAASHSEHHVNFNFQLEHQLIENLNNIAEQPKWEPLFEDICKAFQVSIPFNFFQINLRNENLNLSLGFNRIGQQDYQVIGMKELSIISRMEDNTLETILNQEELGEISTVYNNDAFVKSYTKNAFDKLIAESFYVKSKMYVLYNYKHNTKLSLVFYHKNSDAFKKTQLDVIQKLHGILRKKIAFLLDTEKSVIEVIKGKHLKATPIERHSVFSGIIGTSPLLLNIFDDIRIVAPMNTSVLIMGESGTGKELIAKSIHEFSSRSKKPFVVINCATLPENLIESTLFGHEKGAFTGATETRIGKFEQAQGGTLFLDEIGEMPLEMQVKLLRVLQEREIERIGTNKNIPIDVRIIAATNRNLEEEVESGRFRLDLYYRLHVFPIHSPSLRDRKEDIPLIVDYFIEKFAKEKMQVSHNVLHRMMEYHWPGNIRELENYMERSILSSKENIIKELYKPLINNNVESNNKVTTTDLKPLADMERDYIISVLRLCKGKVFGEGGAAEILQIPTSTLNSKIKKLEITKNDIYTDNE